jgi:hypothetical protein
MFETIEFRTCFICAYLIAYGEYSDGEDTAADKFEAWKKSGYNHMVRYMSVSETDLGFTTQACELCGETGYDECLVVALIPTPQI